LSDTLAADDKQSLEHFELMDASEHFQIWLVGRLSCSLLKRFQCTFIAAKSHYLDRLVIMLYAVAKRRLNLSINLRLMFNLMSTRNDYGSMFTENEWLHELFGSVQWLHPMQVYVHSGSNGEPLFSESYAILCPR
jgi:hypothetical protein